MSSSKKKSRGASRAKQRAVPEQRKAVEGPPTADPPRTKAVAEPSSTVEPEAVKKPSSARMPSAATLILLGILGLALVVRLLPLLYSLHDGRVVFYEYDPYYHMRRILYTVQHFPATNIFDSYVNYPEGFFIGWPPLFDLTAAAASLAVGLGHPDQLTAEVVSSAVPVVLGLLGIGAAFYLVRDAIGERTALFAAFVMAILPGAVVRTMFGYVDHHAMEIFLSLAMYLLFVRSVSLGKAQGLTIATLRAGKTPIIYAALAGVAMAAAVFAWDGAPLLIGVILAYAFVQYTYDAYRKESSDYLTISGLATAIVALAVVGPLAAISYHGQRLEITAIYISWFHIIMVAGITLFFGALGGLAYGLQKRKAPWYALPATIIILGTAAAIGAKVLLPQLYANLEAGLTFLFGGSAVLSSISEVTPLFSLSGTFSLMIAWEYLNTALLIAVPGVLLYLYSLRRRKPTSAEVFLIVWTAVIATLGVLQARFIYLLAVNVAVFTGYGMHRALSAAGLDRFIEVNLRGQAEKRSRRRFRVPWGLLATAIVLVLLLVIPLVHSYRITSTPLPHTVSWDDAAQWMKEGTPKTSYAYAADLGTRPEYGVMTWWDYGNTILYRAERPAVANNFQTNVGDAARFFIAQNESAADRIMEAHNARYVVVDLRMGAAAAGVSGGVFDNMPALAGDDVAGYFMSYRVIDPESGGTFLYRDGNDRYYGTMYSRMFNDHGCGGRNRLGNLTNGLKHYRMVYENAGTDPVIVLEKVKGATIEGRARPGAKVELRLSLSTGISNLTYYSRTDADESGTYRFTVPYATGDMSTAVRTGPAYVIASGDSKVEVGVAGDAVSNGGVVNAGGLL